MPHLYHLFIINVIVIECNKSLWWLVHGSYADPHNLYGAVKNAFSNPSVQNMGLPPQPQIIGELCRQLKEPLIIDLNSGTGSKFSHRIETR